MKFIDMFSGMGTARLGFEMADHECVYSVEWDKHKRQIYKAVFGYEPEGTDIRESTGNELPRADCWIAGFPCQDISVAGKQLGFEGNRSSLYFEVMRLLQEVSEENKPEYLLFENVKNFFSVNNGRDFLEALYQMDARGYDAEWDCLNSRYFGVPQNRERVFIVGHLRTGRTRKVFPLGTTAKQISADIEILAHRKGYRRNSQVYNPNGGIECLDTCQGGGRQPHVAIQINKGNVITKDDGIASCTDANYYKGLDNHAARTGIQVKAVLTPDRAEKRQNGRRIKEDGEPMFTLTKQDRHGIAILSPKRTEYGKQIRKDYEAGSIQESRHNMTQLEPRTDGISNTITTVQKDNLLQWENRIRRLTPREVFRLQAVPEYIIDKIFDAGISDTQCYRAAGDAMTVSVIYEIAKDMRLEGDK